MNVTNTMFELGNDLHYFLSSELETTWEQKVIRCTTKTWFWELSDSHYPQRCVLYEKWLIYSRGMFYCIIFVPESKTFILEKKLCSTLVRTFWLWTQIDARNDIKLGVRERLDKNSNEIDNMPRTLLVLLSLYIMKGLGFISNQL